MCMNRSPGELAPGIVLAGGFAGQELNAFVDGFHRVDVKSSLAYRFDDIVPEHEVWYILDRDQDALCSGESA